MFVITLNPKTVNFNEINMLSNRGFNAYRVNLARNTLEKNIKLIHSLKQYNYKVFIDLPGEKNRIVYRNDVKLLEKGNIISLVKNHDDFCGEFSAMIEDEKIFKISTLGDMFIIGDSNAKLRVIGLSSNQIKLECITPGKLYNKAGLNIEGKYLKNNIYVTKMKK